MRASDSRVRRQSAITVEFEQGEVPMETVSDCQHYPFDITFEVGNAEAQIFLDAKELNSLVQQGLALLQEYDRVMIERMKL